MKDMANKATEICKPRISATYRLDYVDKTMDAIMKARSQDRVQS